MQSLRKRTVCLLTAFRECFWDSTTKRNIWSSVQTNPWQFAIVFITLTRTLIKTLLDILVLIHIFIPPPRFSHWNAQKKWDNLLMWNLFYECFWLVFFLFLIFFSFVSWSVLSHHTSVYLEHMKEGPSTPACLMVEHRRAVKLLFDWRSERILFCFQGNMFSCNYNISFCADATVY